MSKKLIAVAAATALALAGLVGIAPATAVVGPFAVTHTGAATNHVARDGSTAAKAIQIQVPSDDVIRTNTTSVEAAPGLTSNSTSIEFAVKTPGTTDAITVTSTGGVKVLSATQFAATSTTTSATGTQSLTVPAADGDAKVYAYTTTTAGGTVVISAAGSSKTYNIVGLATTAYKMSFTQGASAPLEGKFTLTGTVKDAFGNDMTTALAFGDFNITILGGSAAATKLAVTTTNFTYTAATKTYKITGNVRDTAGSQAVVIDIGNRLIAGTKVTAFGDPVVEQFFTVTANDLATQVTALTAQVAALTADYNALATRWNKKVDSKRRVFNKVPLK